MPIDYDQWDKNDVESTKEYGSRSLEVLERGEKLRLFDLAREVGIKEGESYTLWRGEKSGYLSMRLANLVSYYDKVIIPLQPCPTTEAFAHGYGIRPVQLIEVLEKNPEKFAVTITASPIHFKPQGFYDDFFEACKSEKLYGQLPQNIGFKISHLQLARTYILLACNAGIPPIESWQDEVQRRFPEYNLESIKSEVDQTAGYNAKLWREYAVNQYLTPDIVSSMTSTALFHLRVFGFDALANNILEISKKLRNPVLAGVLLGESDRYLLGPVTEQLCGFSNYTLEDLENMAFFGLLPFERVKLEDARRILLNSPVVRSPLTIPEYKTTLIMPEHEVTHTDFEVLNKLIELSERNRDLTRRIGEYRQSAVEGDLGRAFVAFQKAGEAIEEQYSRELEEWHRKEKKGRLVKGSLAGGVTVLSAVGSILTAVANNSLEWRLAISAAIALAGERAKRWLGKIDPETVAEAIWDVKNWAWYEKGIPYLLWKTEIDPTPEKHREYS